MAKATQQAILKNHPGMSPLVGIANKADQVIGKPIMEDVHNIGNTLSKLGHLAGNIAGGAQQAVLGTGKSKGKKTAPTASPTTATTPTTPTTTPPLNTFGLDPLSTQLFYSGTIAPLLQQNNTRMMDYAKAMQGSLAQTPHSGMPAGFQDLFKSVGHDLGNEYGFLSNALANSAASSPSIDAIMNAVNQDKSKQISTYDIIAKLIANQNGTAGLDPSIIQAILQQAPGLSSTLSPTTPIK